MSYFYSQSASIPTMNSSIPTMNSSIPTMSSPSYQQYSNVGQQQIYSGSCTPLNQQYIPSAQSANTYYTMKTPSAMQYSDFNGNFSAYTPSSKAMDSSNAYYPLQSPSMLQNSLPMQQYSQYSTTPYATNSTYASQYGGPSADAQYVQSVNNFSGGNWLPQCYDEMLPENYMKVEFSNTPPAGYTVTDPKFGHISRKRGAENPSSVKIEEIRTIRNRRRN